MRLFFTHISTPVGDMMAVARNDALVLLDFCDRRDLDTAVASVCHRFDCDPPNENGDHPICNQTRNELVEYFAGQRTAFALPLDLPGVAGSFERGAWDYLRSIPFGETRTYGQQAREIGSPNAARAVGRVNGRNSLCIVLPCHRVIGATGHLTGYGGGVSRKKWLLEHERDQLDPGTLFDARSARLTATTVPR